MGKKELHQKDLKVLLGEFVKTGDPARLREYLLSDSNLPGRRANLELAGAFGDEMEILADRSPGKLWRLCMDFTEISSEEAPVNAPEEFLAFCGAIGLGAIGDVEVDYYERAVSRLRVVANDSRWRMREAVAFGLQRLLAQRSKSTFRELENWAREGTWLEMRAAAAAAAEPAILENDDNALMAMQIHAIIFKRIQEENEPKGEAYKILRKALGYTLSVVVQANPQGGFEFMEQMAATRVKDIVWILKQNLKKKRLAGNYPQQVKALELSLD